MIGALRMTKQEILNKLTTDKTIQDVINTMNEDQIFVLYTLVGMALEEKDIT